MSSDKKSPLASFHVLSGLAQELDAPLRTLVKGSQKLLDEYKSRDFEYISYKDFKNLITGLEQINRQLKRCCITTERVMSLSKGDAQPGQLTKINEAITETLELVSQLLSSAKVKVTTRLASSLPMVKVGKVEVHQIVNNILVNAVQAMPAGGKIKIRTAFNKDKNMVTLEIEDEGVGITPAHLSKVFEPFFTTKERGVEKSAGLGLSVVYGILQTNGGDISIQSSLRKGTTVHIDFPAAPGTAA